MQRSIKWLLITGLSLFATFPARAQGNGPATVDVAGDSRNIRGITHEYAIGQVVSGEPSVFGGLIVTPGVLQPTLRRRFLPEKGIDPSELRVFPSPASSTLYLQPAFRRAGTLSYALFDAGGKLVAARETELAVGSEPQQLDVSLLASGQYFLRVTWTAGRATPRASGYKIQKLK